MYRMRPRRLKHGLIFRSPTFAIFGEQFAKRSIGWELLLAALATTCSAQDFGQPFVSAACPADISITTYVRNQSCYEFKGVQKTWLDARDYCYDRGGRLVSITNADLQRWLSNTAAQLWPERKGVWIGLNDRTTGGVFMWDDYGTNAERQMSYSNWASGYPRNLIISGDCVQIRSDYAWKWVEKDCNSPAFTYNHICEYRTSHIFHAGTKTGKSGIALPLSLSLTAVVVAVALVTAGVVVWRHQQRYRRSTRSIVTGNRQDTDEERNVYQPTYSIHPDQAMDKTSMIHESGRCGLRGRPILDHYSETRSTEPAVEYLIDGAQDYVLPNQVTDPVYAVPILQEPSAVTAAELATPYTQYASIETTDLMKLQQLETSVGEGTSCDKMVGSVLADSDWQFHQIQTPHGITSTQGDYESLMSKWTPNDNVQNDHEYCELKPVA